MASLAVGKDADSPVRDSQAAESDSKWALNALRKWTHKWCRQFYAVMKKNWILTKRNRRATLVQMLVPLLLVFILFVLQFAVTANQYRSELVRVQKSSDVHDVPSIQPCVVGKGLSHCYSLAYTPSSDAVVEQIVYNIAAADGLANSTIIAFPTPEELDRFLAANPNTTQGAVHFKVLYRNDDPGDDVLGFRYALQFNQTLTFRRGQPTNPALDFLLPMQRSVERETMRYIQQRYGDTSGFLFEAGYLSYPHPEIRPVNLVGRAGPIFFFGALMFNFVIQLGQVVREKEMRLKTSMKIMGCKSSVLWTSWVLFFMAFNSISSFLLTISGLLFQFPFFLKNDFGLYFFLFQLFGFAMVPLVMLLSVFVTKARSATVLGFGVFLIGSLIQGFASIVFDVDTDEYLVILFSFLPFALLAKSMADLANESNTASSVGIRWEDRATYEPLGDIMRIPDVYNWLIINFFIFLALALYLAMVWPDENGNREHPLFFLFPSWWYKVLGLDRRRYRLQLAAQAKQCDGNKDSSHENDRGDEDRVDAHDVRDSVENLEGEELEARRHLQIALEGRDDDVLAENQFVEQLGSLLSIETYPVLLRNLGIVFRGRRLLVLPDHSKDFHAVRGLSLALRNNTLFCLLGHNGAGKTTLINMLTGILSPTYGEAHLLSCSVVKDMPSIRKSMGVCPQHDILWDDLTAAEHLELYATFKGIPFGESMQREVRDRLRDIGFLESESSASETEGSREKDTGDEKDRQAVVYSGRNYSAVSADFSGGMRRRLSVAIALVGNPRIVFLDEPTTGMDPVARRHVWDLIERVKRGRIVVLTTHAMEEADVLGDRIGIMKQGRFICMGTSLHLKQKFGSGYSVTFMSPASAYKGIEDFVSQHLPEAKCQGSSEGSLRFKTPQAAGQKLPDFFEKLEANRRKLAITDIQLSLTTLEEVFLSIGAIGDHDERHGERVSEDVLISPSLWQRFRRLSRCKKALVVLGTLLALLVLVNVIVLLTSGEGGPPSPTVPTFAASTTSLFDLPRGQWLELQTPRAVTSAAEGNIAVGPGETLCARGEDYSFFVYRPPAEVELPRKLVIEFEGGASCFDASSCDLSLDEERYLASVDDSRERVAENLKGGLFDHDTPAPANPVAGWLHLYVPLCTADYHWGNRTTQYDAGRTLHHRGAANAFAALNWTLSWLNSSSAFEPLDSVLLAGWSSGAYAAVLWAPFVTEQAPAANLTLLTDSAIDGWARLGESSVSTRPPNLAPLFDVLEENVVPIFRQWYGKALQAWGVLDGLPDALLQPLSRLSPSLHQLLLSSEPTPPSETLPRYVPPPASNFTLESALLELVNTEPRLQIARYAVLFHDEQLVQWSLGRLRWSPSVFSSPLLSPAAVVALAPFVVCNLLRDMTRQLQIELGLSGTEASRQYHYYASGGDARLHGVIDMDLMGTLQTPVGANASSPPLGFASFLDALLRAEQRSSADNSLFLCDVALTSLLNNQ